MASTGPSTSSSNFLPVQGCGVPVSDATLCSRLPGGRFGAFLGTGPFFTGTVAPFLFFASLGLSFSGFGHSTSCVKSRRATGTHSSRRGGGGAGGRGGG